MADQRSEFEIIVKRATSVAAQSIVELDFTKRKRLDAIFDNVDERVMALFFPEDTVVAEPVKAKKTRAPRKKPVKREEDVL